MSFDVVLGNDSRVFFLGYFNDLDFQKVKKNIRQLYDDDIGIYFEMVQKLFLWPYLESVVAYKQTRHKHVDIHR